MKEVSFVGLWLLGDDWTLVEHTSDQIFTYWMSGFSLDDLEMSSDGMTTGHQRKAIFG